MPNWTRRDLLKAGVAASVGAAAFGAIGLCEELNSAVESRLFVRHAVVVPQKDFSEPNLTRLAREFVERFRTVPFAELDMAPDRLALYAIQGHTEGNYRSWISSLKTDIEGGWEPRPCFAAANVIGGQAVLRMRVAGKVHRLVLAGKDPLLQDVGGRHYDILEIAGAPHVEDYPETFPTIVKCGDCVKDLEVFVRTQPPLDMGSFKALAARLRALARPMDLDVYLRTDTWFAGFGSFPRLYPFDEEFKLPTYSECDRALSAGALVDGRTGRIRVNGPFGGPANR